MSAMAKITTAVGHGSRKQRVHHHKRHLSRSSSSAAVDYPPGNALINELGNPDSMFVTENGTVVTSQIGGSAILPCATTKLGTATVSTLMIIRNTQLISSYTTHYFKIELQKIVQFYCSDKKNVGKNKSLTTREKVYPFSTFNHIDRYFNPCTQPYVCLCVQYIYL